jgi:type IV pilus assembly protein PilP
MSAGKILAVCLLPLLLVACGGDEHSDVKQWMNESTKDLRGHVPPLPEIKPFPVVSYDASELVDPFSAAKIVPEKRTGGTGLKPDFDRPKEPLEAFPLESLKMVGVMRKNSVNYALINANGVVYQVRAGNHVGQNFGFIISITDSEINIRELVQDPTGQTSDWVERPATLQLQEQADQSPKGAGR